MKQCLSLFQRAKYNSGQQPFSLNKKDFGGNGFTSRLLGRIWKIVCFMGCLFVFGGLFVNLKYKQEKKWMQWSIVVIAVFPTFLNVLFRF